MRTSFDRTTNALYPAVANSPRLLFPDELYCPRVAIPVFGLNYALASVAFCLAAGVSYKTKSLVSCNAYTSHSLLYQRSCHRGTFGFAKGRSFIQVQFYWRRGQRKKRKRGEKAKAKYGTMK